MPGRYNPAYSASYYRASAAIFAAGGAVLLFSGSIMGGLGAFAFSGGSLWLLRVRLRLDRHRADL
jgi:hypothetical protein